MKQPYDSSQNSCVKKALPWQSNDQVMSPTSVEPWMADYSIRTKFAAADYSPFGVAVGSDLLHYNHACIELIDHKLEWLIADDVLSLNVAWDSDNFANKSRNG